MAVVPNQKELPPLANARHLPKKEHSVPGKHGQVVIAGSTAANDIFLFGIIS
jgi:hypothetical protein